MWFKREGTYVYLWLIHVDVWQKPIQYCKAITHQSEYSNQHSQIMYCAGWGQRYMLLHRYWKEGSTDQSIPVLYGAPHVCKVLRCTKTGFGTKTEDFRYLRIFTTSTGHNFFFRNEGKFSHFWAILLCQLYNIACNFINISKR